MKTKTKFWLVCTSLFIGLLYMIGFVTGIGPYDLPPQSRKLDEVMAESKRLGLPMTAAELVGEIPPPETNAAPGVLSAFPRKFIKLQSNFKHFKISELIAMSKKDRANVEAEVDLYSKLLASVTIEVENKPNWYVSRDYDLGHLLLFKEYADLKYVGKLFAQRSRLRALRNDSKGAIEDLVAARKLASLVSKEPVLIGLLVAIALDSYALRLVEDLGYVFRDDARALKDLETALVKTQSKFSPLQSLRAEFYLALTITRNLKAFGGLKSLSDSDETEFVPRQLDPSVLQREGLPQGTLARASMASFAEAWNKVFSEISSNSGSWEGYGKRIDHITDEWENQFRISHLLPKFLFPAYLQSEATLNRHAVMQECAIAYVRAFASKKANGKWPVDLAELGMKIEDPFAPGSSVKFVFSDSEVKIWNVGVNGIDDGGVMGSMGSIGLGKGRYGDDMGMLWPRETIYAKAKSGSS